MRSGQILPAALAALLLLLALPAPAACEPSFRVSVVTMLSCSVGGRHYLCAWLSFETYFMFSEADEVYLTVRLTPVTPIHVRLMTVKLGNYKATLLADSELFSDFETNITVPREALDHYNQLECNIFWSPRLGAEEQVEEQATYLYVSPLVVMAEKTYRDLERSHSLLSLITIAELVVIVALAFCASVYRRRAAELEARLREQ